MSNIDNLITLILGPVSMHTISDTPLLISPNNHLVQKKKVIAFCLIMKQNKNKDPVTVLNYVPLTFYLVAHVNFNIKISEH